MSIVRIVLALSLVVAPSTLGRADDVVAIPTGVARVDVTPDYPIRLSGFGGRRDEATSARAPLFARAIAFGEGEQTSVWLCVDSIGISAAMTKTVAERLREKAGVRVERVAVSATHSHTAPCLSGMINTLFGAPVPAEHQSHIDRYTGELIDKMEEAALAALADRRPAKWEWGVGSADFAINRRTAGGPVDHSLSVLRITAPDGRVRAICVNYACHCVVLSDNQLSGDWAGYAAEHLERSHDGAVALVSIGCGADSNPASGVTGDRGDVAAGYGGDIAGAVAKVFEKPMKPVRGPVDARLSEISLPFDTHPTREEWQERAKGDGAIAYHARVQLERLDRGEKLMEQLPYAVQTWRFGDDLAMVFLPGEVVVDYSLRLKKELDGERLWINAYSNDCPCYIPSERILKEGGYEGGGAMIYYDRPTRLASGVEKLIVDEVHRQLPKDWISARHDAEHRAKFPPPLSPEESLATIVARPGMRVELAVAEPLIASPVAIDFGTDGRLWVAEMYDYPSGTDGDFQPGGRVRSVTDSDGDGKYDAATVFLDKIPFPTGVMAWREGVLVCAAPDVLYAVDKDGDGRADELKTLLTGFATENYQARVNSVFYGLDNWVYGANGLLGGDITSTLTGAVTPLAGRDFRWRPDTGEFELVAGLTQQGRARDDWQNWIGGDSGTVARHYPLDDRYAKRNPHVAAPAPSVSIARDADPNKLFPRSVILERFNDPETAGRMTSACSPMIYRDRLLGEDCYGDLFVCEPVHNVVTRREITRDGVVLAGVRSDDEKDSEFLAATDSWFRPVQAITGPDGALWIVDMYRFVIEHPRWITPERLAELDVRAGADKGRLYRILPADGAARPWPKLAGAGHAELLEAIQSENGMVRDMAQREIAHRQDPSIVAGLVGVTQNSQQPAGRIQALAALESLGEVTATTLPPLLADEHGDVRALAVRFSEPLLVNDEKLLKTVCKLATDSNSRVRMQVACSLAGLGSPEASAALANIAVADRSDPYIVGAVASSIDERNVAAVFQEVWRNTSDEQFAGDEAAQRLRSMMLTLAAAIGDASAGAKALANVLSGEPQQASAGQMTACAALLDALARRGSEWRKDEAALAKWRQYRQFALEAAADEAHDASLRLACARLLARDDDTMEDDLAVLRDLLAPQQPVELQAAAIERLSSAAREAATTTLLDAWPELSPGMRGKAFDALLDRNESAALVLTYLENQPSAAGSVDAARRQRLLAYANEGLRKRAETLWSAASDGDRAAVIREYAAALTALDAEPSVERGAEVFKKQCSVCHKLRDVGHAVGPDLAALTDRSPGAMLAAVLSPSKDVESRYLSYSLQTADGRVLTGMLTEETGNSLTLLGQESKKEVVLRRDIEALMASGKSLMPDGLEKEIPPAAMADLFAYLSGFGPKPKTVDGNTPQLVRASPGEPIQLHASLAEIYGQDITFEPPLANIGLWHSRQDHIAWSFVTDVPAEYDVVLEYACDLTSAGNRFEVTVAGQTLSGRVGGTGAGWSHYIPVRLGAVKLGAGQHRLVMRPSAELRSALADVKRIELVPK